uniref:Alpha-glucosidase n=1 Tax=Panagrellus redivivus TaxID=6233 RepID=A0A7E4VL12_PANRE
MERYKDFTYDHDKWGEWPNYTDYLHSQGQKVFLIYDPAIQVNYDVFERAQAQNVSWINWPKDELVMRDIQNQYPLAKDTNIMLGVVWPDEHVGFPDFLDPSNLTTKWWADEFKRYHDLQAFDAIWIDMNEPANFATNREHPFYFDMDDHPNIANLFCPTNGSDAKLDVPPYKTMSVYVWGNQSFMAENTLCMCGTAVRGKSTVYDTKSLYGWAETVATWEALKVSVGKRSAVVSRSTFPTSGQYAGHWLGDNTARWEDLRTAIIGAQEFNLFGIPYVGSDICGFLGNATEELCLRWQQAGAYHSFMRNHNDIKSELQDPTIWPSVAKATRHSNLFRYRHLPYLYSLHFNVSRFGGTVIRPVFFEFPSDPATYDLSYQFMWGPAVMVAPVTSPGVNAVHVYLPTDADWYSLFDTYYGNYMDAGAGFFAAPWTSISPTFLRAGYILPRQAPALTTVAARENHFELVIGSKIDASTGTGSASGEMYWDDGEAWIDLGEIESSDFFHFKFDFKYDPESATLTITSDKMVANMTLPTLDNIEIFGYQHIPDRSEVFLNGQQIAIDSMAYVQANHILNITSHGLIDLNEGTATLTWKNKQSNVQYDALSDAVSFTQIFGIYLMTPLFVFFFL